MSWNIVAKLDCNLEVIRGLDICTLWRSCVTYMMRNPRSCVLACIGGGGAMLTGYVCTFRHRVHPVHAWEALSQTFCSIVRRSRRPKQEKIDKFKDYTQEERYWWRSQREAEKLVQLARLKQAMGGDAELTLAIDMSFGEDVQIDKGARYE